MHVQPRGVQLKLTVLSAHNLPKSRDERCVPQPHDDYWPPACFGDKPLTAAGVVSAQCELEVIGPRVGDEGCGSEERWSKTTRVVPDNGLSPSWASEPLSCAVWAPEQSFVKLSVYNCAARNIARITGGRTLLAYEQLPLAALRPGYRSLPLRSPIGSSPIESCVLLCRIELTPLTPPATRTVSLPQRAVSLSRPAGPKGARSTFLTSLVRQRTGGVRPSASRVSIGAETPRESPAPAPST